MAAIAKGTDGSESAVPSGLPEPPEPTPDGAFAGFTRADCEVFKHIEGGTSLTKVSPTDRQKLSALREKVKALGETACGRMHSNIPLSAKPSQWNVHGTVSSDLWSCVIPKAALHKAYTLQIGFILSARGGEMCFSLGSATVGGNDRPAWAAELRLIKQRLPVTPASIVEAAENQLVSPWVYRKAWRLAPGPSDFEGLSEWLAYAGTRAGSGATISRYYTPQELEDRGSELIADMVELGETAMPILEFAVREHGAVAPPHVEPPDVTNTHDFEWLCKQTLWAPADLQAIIDALGGTSLQVVLAGPPGTGKTWVAKHLIQHLTGGSADCSRVVQFHPSYGYEDFIEGLRPQAVAGAMSFERVDGIVLEIAKLVGQREAPFYLLIDEMNRANLSRVFGELMYLFEYRDEAMSLRYTKDFELPRAMRFIGTMNTADRSIRSIDIALRRRFEVFECPPSPNILEAFYASGRPNEIDSLVTGFKKLNAELRIRIDGHHTVGHTFFMAPTMTPAVLDAIWRRRIRPLLEEYFFDEPEVVSSVFRPEMYWPELATS